MSKSKNLANNKLIQILGLVALAVMLLIGATFGRASWRESTSNHYLNLALKHPIDDDTPLNYEFAALLSPTPENVRLQESSYYDQKHQPDAAISVLLPFKSDRALALIASIQSKYGQTREALATLDRIVNKSDANNLLLSRVSLEAGDTAKAIAVSEAIKTDDIQGNRTLQLGLAYLTVGDSANASALMALAAPSEGLGALRKASVSKYGLAARLAHSGLLNSAERVLDSQQIKASDEWQLWGTIRLAHRTSKPDMLVTASKLDKAVKADPSNLRLRKLLRETYFKLDDGANIATQTDLIGRLESGTP